MDELCNFTGDQKPENTKQKTKIQASLLKFLCKEGRIEGSKRGAFSVELFIFDGVRKKNTKSSQTRNSYRF